MAGWRSTSDERFLGLTQRVRNVLVRHGFHHLMEAARLSDDAANGANIALLWKLPR